METGRRGTDLVRKSHRTHQTEDRLKKTGGGKNGNQVTRGGRAEVKRHRVETAECVSLTKHEETEEKTNGEQTGKETRAMQAGVKGQARRKGEKEGKESQQATTRINERGKERARDKVVTTGPKSTDPRLAAAAGGRKP